MKPTVIKHGGSLKKKIRKPEQEQNIISQTSYICQILTKNIELSENYSSFGLEKYISTFTERDFFKFYSSLKYLSKTKLLYMSNNKNIFIDNKNYLSVFLYLLVFFFEIEKEKIKNHKNTCLSFYLNLLEKCFNEKKLSDEDIITIIHFIVFSSIYERKDVNILKIRLLSCLSNKLIRNYSRFKFAIAIIKKINKINITLEFCDFLKNCVIKHKPNLYMITEKNDILEILYLNDEEEEEDNKFMKNTKSKIISFLAFIYSFKYNKNFLDLFLKQIKQQYISKYQKYNDAKENNNPIEVLNKLNRNILLLKNIQKNEDEIYEKDSYILSHGFVCNNDRYNGISVNSVVLQSEFTVIFSFNFSPEETAKKAKEENPIKDNTNLKIKRGKGLLPEIPEFPIIYLISENNRKGSDGFSFFIKQNTLYHKVFNSDELKKICEIKENKTYICYYSFREYNQYKIVIKTEKNSYSIKEPYKIQLKKNLTLQVGKFNHQNFEGYIGPILFFKNYIDDELKNLVFNLKGNYENLLYVHDYVNKFIDKYDRNMNYTTMIFDFQNNENYSGVIKKLKESMSSDINLSLLVTPENKGSNLEKTLYINCCFIESKISYYIKPKVESGATFFFRNNYTPFEFLKYEGINYLILCYELIIANVDNMQNQYHKKIILNIFINIIEYSQDLIYLLNADYYVEEVRQILFAVKKTVNKICKKLKMFDEISKTLNKWLISLTCRNPELPAKRLEFYNKIRNEICKFLLDIELFDLKNYSSIEYFLCAINNCLDKKPKGLLSMEIFQKIINFSIIFEKREKIEKNNFIGKNNLEYINKRKDYKNLKKQFMKLLVFFMTKSENMIYSIYFWQLCSIDIKFDYKKYQFIKIFYLSSEYYFNHIDNKNFINTWKYFIDLYEYLKNNEIEKEINEKQSQILMAICLRIIFEYPITGDFFKRIKIKQKKPTTTNFTRKHKKTGSGLNSKTTILSLEFTGVDTLAEINEEDKFKQSLTLFEIKNKNAINSGSHCNSINSQHKRSISEDNKKIKEKNRKKKNTGIKKFYNKYGFEWTKNKKEEIEEKFDLKRNNSQNKIPSSLNNSNYINNTKNEYLSKYILADKINNKINNKNNNTNNLRNSGKKSFVTTNSSNSNNDSFIRSSLESSISTFESNAYIDYSSYYNLFPKLCSSVRFNDYCFKSLILLVLETNNEVSISQETKLNFITKVKNFQDLINEDFEPFLTLKYFSKETKEQFLKILTLIEKNLKYLSLVPFDIILYIIIQVSKDQQKNKNSKCVFNHLIRSKRICNRLFLLAFTHSKEASDSIMREFSTLTKNIMPYHRNPFIIDFLHDISVNKDLYQHGQVLINILMLMSFEREIQTKFYYHFKVNTVILLYRIIKHKKNNKESKNEKKEKKNENNKESNKENNEESNNKKNNEEKNEYFNYNEKGLNTLFNDDLILSRFNMLKDCTSFPLLANKKKSYVELLFDFMINLCIKTSNDKYILLTYQMFIMYIQHFKSNNIESQSVIYYLDQIKSGPTNKNNPILKFFPKYDSIEVPSLCVKFLLKTLKYWSKVEEGGVKNLLASLASAFYTDSKLIFLEQKNKRSKYKNYYLYNYLRDRIIDSITKDDSKSKATNKKISQNLSVDGLLKKFKTVYEKYLEQKKKNTDSNLSAKKLDRSTSLLIPDHPNMSIDLLSNVNALDESFSSCKSSKSLKQICTINQKKKYKTDKRKPNLIDDLVDNLDKREELFNLDEDEEIFSPSSRVSYATTVNNSNQNNFNSSTKNMVIVGNFRKESGSINKNNNLNYTNSDSFKRERSAANLISNRGAYKRNALDLEKIETINKVILFPKQFLLEQVFGIYFIDIFFYNKNFILMKNYFKYLIEKENKDKNISFNSSLSNSEKNEISLENFFNYPIITKNYTPMNFYYGDLFLKNDLNFFNNKYFHISHPYFIEFVKNCFNPRVFQKISDQDDINKFILDKKDPNNFTFYVDLVTNRNVVFGQLIVGKFLIYFENLDKNEFLKGKSDEEVAKWLLGSPDYDYSNRNKKLYIFKKEISQIINRRFLYLFQACEFYLKNGKSYYFNFYSEEKKIEFFSIFANGNNYGIKIISDLKSEFKKKNFTKQWLNNSISTLEYLLFINKYASRSYNDVNQYPVLPWLVLFGDKIRDLQYTTAAQTEDDRYILKEKYPLSSDHFPYHYTTHYSNASFLIYYLIRINPFTDNQITLQERKFDAPERQFCSIDELQKILKTTKQPREVIPEFFVSTEFFYNYNCNYFGIRNKKDLVNNLKNKNNFISPLEYILNNAVLLESPYFKSKVNYFFDNIFGIGQIGGCDKCNTYDKYSYQEMIDLRQKIRTFQEKKLPLEKIKEKINKKANKIISFGQTPFKLLEDKHPQWVNILGGGATPNEEGMTGTNNNNPDLTSGFSIKEFSLQIIHFESSKNVNGKSFLYVLAKKNINNYELNFFDLKLKEDKENKERGFLIQKKLKLFSKLRIFKSNFLFAYKYNPKFLMIHYSLSIFILGHLSDNSLAIYNIKGEFKNYRTESLITCIIKGPQYFFFTGHVDGKIFEWEFNGMSEILNSNNSSTNVVNLSEISIKLKRNFFGHKDRVSGIYYSHSLGLIITSGDDRKIFVRKYYDLSVVSVINNEEKICINIRQKYCYLYILFFDEKEKKHIVEIYSVNGIQTAKSEYGLINNIDFDKEGNLLIGYFNENKISIFNPSLTKKLVDVELKIHSAKNNDKNKNKKKGGSLAGKGFEVDDSNIFQTFCYKRENSSVYCSYSNGVLLQKTLGNYNKNKKD